MQSHFFHHFVRRIRTWAFLYRLGCLVPLLAIGCSHSQPITVETPHHSPYTTQTRPSAPPSPLPTERSPAPSVRSVRQEQPPVQRIAIPPVENETIFWEESPEKTAEILQNAPFVSASSIGHTSVVLKVRLRESPEKTTTALFKPASRKNGGWRYKGEIAAYRLAKALYLPNVPPAWLRIVKSWALELAAQKNPIALALIQKEVSPYAEDDLVYGALIPWIPGYEELPLGEPSVSRIWHGWLQGTIGIPEDQITLAKELSNLLIFDYITGNFDRWSGANVVHDKHTGMILFVDNDGAFWLEDEDTEKPWALVSTINRFSKSLFESIRSMSPEDFKASLGEKTPGVPLIRESLANAAYKRLQQVVALIEQKSEQDPSTLFFE